MKAFDLFKMAEYNLQEHWHSVPNHMTADIENPKTDQSEHNEANKIW